MLKRTALFDSHRAAGARMVPFADWEMPLHYGSQIAEHHAVRRGAGMFDVSHMTIVDLRGDRARDFLRKLLANDVGKLTEPGRALYSCMLNERGGVIDDLIVYHLDATCYRMVVNAATRDRDLDWIGSLAAAFGVEVAERSDLAMVAIQGPQARAKTLEVLPEKIREAVDALSPFLAAGLDQWFIGRTGYTGEDGFEVMVPAAEAPEFWRRLAEVGVAPCGLGARDTLRLEAGMNLYGIDMDETTSPLESGLAWTVAWQPEDRAFIGRDALMELRARDDLCRFVGLVLDGKGVLRNHQAVFADGRQVGEITSGGFAPTLGVSIALARLTHDAPSRCTVEIRGRSLPVRVVAPPFVRHGKVRIELAS